MTGNGYLISSQPGVPLAPGRVPVPQPRCTAAMPVPVPVAIPNVFKVARRCQHNSADNPFLVLLKGSFFKFTYPRRKQGDYGKLGNHFGKTDMEP